MIVNRKTVGRIAGVGAASALAIGLLSTGAANADTFVPLPGGHITQTLPDGTVVDLSIENESININPSLGATPVHRNAWVSGTARVNLQGEHASGGSIFPGYILACQLTIGGEGNGGAGVEIAPDGEGNVTATPSGSVDGTVVLGPGEAQSVYILDLEQADDFGSETHKKRNKFTGTSGSVTWADSSIGISGCAGYAQVRSFVNTEVETDSGITWLTVWGQPTSIG